MTRATTTRKPRIYDVLPHDGDPTRRWETHIKGGRAHTYFATQREAIAAARRMAETQRPAKVVLHARDGHAYREFTID